MTTPMTTSDELDGAEIERVVAGLSEAERADLLSGDWYLASCDHCGWFGSSRLCGTDLGWDDSDVYCPKCHRSGADMGKISDAYDDAVCAHLARTERRVEGGGADANPS